MFGTEFAEHREEIGARPGRVAVTSAILPEGTECDTPRELFGVGLALLAGRRTWIEGVRRDGELVTGQVQASDDGAAFGVNFGEFHLAAWPEDEPERVSHTQGEVSDGFGRVLLSNETIRDLNEGRRVWFCLARPADNSFSLAVTEVELLV